MHHLHGRLERLHAKVRETLATEFPDVPLGTLQPVVCMPYPEDDRDLVFFYGEGVAPHADFDYATTRLSDLLQQDGIDTAFARVSRAAYEEHLKTTGQDDEPEQRFLFLARTCGCRDAPDSILSFPLFAPAVVGVTRPGGQTRAQFLVV